MDIDKILDMIKNGENVSLLELEKTDTNNDKVYINEGILPNKK